MTPELIAADRALAELARSFDFLLAVTPTSIDAAWDEFQSSGKEPAWTYRPLSLDPVDARRRLASIAVPESQPLLAGLMRDRIDELDRQIALVGHRGTAEFLPVSRTIYPAVEASLLAEARTVLARVPASSASPALRRPDTVVMPAADAAVVVERAKAELAAYRAAYPGLTATAEIREDISSLMVSHGNLLVPSGICLAAHRVDALLQHEVGTHVVTYANGAAQPLQILADGLAGYEALQEGLAMLAEFVAGGLDGERLRLIAARVVAVHQLVAGSDFPAVFHTLVVEYGVPRRAAFGIAMRVFRGGGFTKDAIYLRGLVQLLSYFAEGGALDPLLVGKIGFAQLAAVAQLLADGHLQPPALVPRWLTAPANATRLTRLRGGLRPADLVTTGATA